MTAIAALEPRPGSYLLWLQVPARRTLRIGRLGEALFEAGVYGYAGSALGPGGVRARLARHLSTGKSLRWHIDYLRAAAEVHGVWVIYDKKRYEHDLAQALLSLKGAKKPLIGFGSSDCACETHLVGFSQPVSLAKPLFSGRRMTAIAADTGSVLARITYNR